MKLQWIIISATSLALIFQLAHFAEHTIQAWQWIAGFRNMPYMSPPATELSWILGEWIVPGEEDYHRIFKLGAESLHLIGNTVFLFGIIGLRILCKSKLVTLALIFQGIHLFEHIMLFSTEYFIHQAIGMSTLFGYFQPYGTDLYNHVTMTTFRVWWHFIVNLIPTVLAGYAVWRRIRKQA